MTDASLLVDYIYLDSEERRRFAQVGHEYLIEQLQFTGEESVQLRNEKFKLGFNHPTKELIWALRNGLYCSENNFLAYTHEEDWTEALNEAAKKLVECTLTCSNGTPTADGDWSDTPDIDSPAGWVFAGLTNSGMSGADLWLNKTAAYCVDGTNLYDKIDSATISVQEDGSGNCVGFTVTSVSHTLNIRDISFPVSAADVTDLDLSGKTVCVCQWHNYGVLIDGTVNPVSEALIQLNGHDRFDKREGSYFNYVQPHQHHTNTPADGINVYSFALHPEQHQPSGTANLSRIDNTQLNVTFADGSIALYSGNTDIPFLNNADSLFYIFAYSYNVLRIMSGMGGLAYSN